MMFEDSKKVAAVALGSFLDHISDSKNNRNNRSTSSATSSSSASSSNTNNTIGKSPMARLSNFFTHSSSTSKNNNNSTPSTVRSSSRIVELGIATEVNNSVMSPNSQPSEASQLSGRKMINALRFELSKWNEGMFCEKLKN